MDDSLATFAKLRSTTAPRLLAEHARYKGKTIAFRAKYRGVYRERTWRDYALLVAACALGLRSLGLRRGERVAIMGNAGEEWMICDLAAQSLGCITYGIYPTASVSELNYLIQDGGAAIFIAENQEYVDKILPLVDRLPHLRSIVVIDHSALFSYTHPKLCAYSDVTARGMFAEEERLCALEDMAREVGCADPAFIIYTSGTTGNPKGALVAHGKHLAAAFTIVDHYPILARSEHRTVAFLPLCHVFGRDIAITLPLISHLVPHFGEDIDDLPQTLFEVAPSVLFTVPRYLQKFASQVLIAVNNTTRVKRAAYDVAMLLGRACARRRWAGRNAAFTAVMGFLARALALRGILSKLGLDRIELMISGGAPLPPETAALWQIWGVNLVQAYGQTETAGAFISAQAQAFAKPGNVGTVVRGWRAKLGQGGEILVNGPDLFEGYWRNEEATREILDTDGWMHTGDVGEWENGNLRLVDRARDFLVTAGGKTLSPSVIENLLRASPYIAEAIVLGHGRKYLTALIEIDADAVSDWARSNGVSYTGFASLADNAQVRQLLDEEVARANAELARVEQIKSFRILPKELDPEQEGEAVTPTRKIKRKLIHEQFKPLVDDMYGESEERMVAASTGNALRG